MKGRKIAFPLFILALSSGAWAESQSRGPAPARLRDFRFAVPGLASLAVGTSLAPVNIPGIGSAKAEPFPRLGIIVAPPAPQILDLNKAADRQTMRQLLEAGFPVTPARNGAEALEFAAKISEVVDGLRGKGVVLGTLAGGLSPAAVGRDGSAQSPGEKREASSTPGGVMRRPGSQDRLAGPRNEPGKGNRERIKINDSKIPQGLLGHLEGVATTGWFRTVSGLSMLEVGLMITGSRPQSFEMGFMGLILFFGGLSLLLMGLASMFADKPDSVGSAVKKSVEIPGKPTAASNRQGELLKGEKR